jgi:hypothetical protein
MTRIILIMGQIITLRMGVKYDVLPIKYRIETTLREQDSQTKANGLFLLKKNKKGTIDKNKAINITVLARKSPNPIESIIFLKLFLIYSTISVIPQAVKKKSRPARGDLVFSEKSEFVTSSHFCGDGRGRRRS